MVVPVGHAERKGHHCGFSRENASSLLPRTAHNPIRKGLGLGPHERAMQAVTLPPARG